MSSTKGKNQPINSQKQQHRLLQTICKRERQRMLQGRQFVLPRSPGAVSWGTDPPPPYAWGAQVQHSPRQEQKAVSSSCKLDRKPQFQPARAAGTARCRDNTRMPMKYKPKGAGVKTHNGKCPFGECWDKRNFFFFFKVVSRAEIPSGVFSRGDPSSPAALGSGEFNYGKSFQATLARKHSPTCPLPTKRTSCTS